MTLLGESKITDSMEVDTPVTKSGPKDSAKKSSVVGEDDSVSKYPDMNLAQLIHRIAMIATQNNKLDSITAQSLGLSFEFIGNVLQQVSGPDVENPTLYRHLKNILQSEQVNNAILSTASSLSDLAFLSEEEIGAMEQKHKATVTSLEVKVEEAKEKAGDMEVLDARFELARFAAKSLSKTEAIEAYDKILTLPKLSSGKMMDALMESARVASFYGDYKKCDELITRTNKIAEDGGDWDRRNKLKIYRALSKIVSRDFKASASLLVDCIATFSCSEFCSYKDFVVYTVLSNILYLPRTEMKEKIIDGPEILSVATDIPVVIRLAHALYDCDYKAYLHAIVDIYPILVGDRYLQPHCGYIIRELHVLGYKQFLESYKSVTLEAMAASFGISMEFLDLQLSRFIAAGRLSAKIDKFGGIVETNRPDLKNAQYRDMIHKGDLLLNRMQQLSRVLDI